MYIQVDGVAVRSTLGTLLANIFQSTLEEHLIPTLGDCLPHWKRYVDNTHANINPNKLNYIIKALNNYHPKIKFTYELEKEDLIRRLNDEVIETTVFRKETKTNIYINWNSHALMQWKIGILTNVIQ